jgi:hypothetical protein
MEADEKCDQKLLQGVYQQRHAAFTRNVEKSKQMALQLSPQAF